MGKNYSAIRAHQIGQSKNAILKTAKENKPEHKLALALCHIAGCLIVEQTAAELANATRQDVKQHINSMRKRTKSYLGSFATRVGMSGHFKGWQLSEERMNMRISVISDFAIRMLKYPDSDSFLDWCSEQVDLMDINAMNRMHAGEFDRSEEEEQEVKEAYEAS